MKSLLLMFSISTMVVSHLFGQSNCDCYSVEAIEVHSVSDSSNASPIFDLSDTISNEIDFTLKNTCDNNVYLKLFMISNSNDTLAWTDTWSIFVLPLNTNVIWRINTKLSALPPFGSYRISLISHTLICEAVRIRTLVAGITENNSETGKKTAFYPNPVSHILKIVGDREFQTIVVYNPKGQVLMEMDNLRSASVELSTEHLTSGIYTVKTIDYVGNTLIKKIVK